VLELLRATEAGARTSGDDDRPYNVGHVGRG
jgi:hypothetical protein